MSLACMLTGFGAFAGLGQPAASTPAASAGSSFGKGLSFGASVPAASGGGFSAFGQHASMGAAAAPPVGQQPTAAASGGPFPGSIFGGSGFGQAARFSQAQSSPGFGQPSPLGAGFGHSAMPGVRHEPAGTIITGRSGLAQSCHWCPCAGFGAAATPGFGTPATPGFGAPALLGSPQGFGGAAGFGAAASQPGTCW